jgi:hypothetical protein
LSSSVFVGEAGEAGEAGLKRNNAPFAQTSARERSEEL